MTEIITEGLGTARIADEVIAVIAGTAALEAEGVAGLARHFSSDIGEKSTRRHMSKGVQLSVDGNNVVISIEISVKFGKKLQEVSKEVQQKIKTAVETMTGLNVVKVNVIVGALASEKQRRP